MNLPPPITSSTEFKQLQEDGTPVVVFCLFSHEISCFLILFIQVLKGVSSYYVNAVMPQPLMDVAQMASELTGLFGRMLEEIKSPPTTSATTTTTTTTRIAPPV
jgi:hypothetical protein